MLVVSLDISLISDASPFFLPHRNDDPVMNMNTEGTSKLESMPGEVVEVMAGIMKRWSVVEGNLEQRRKARM